MQLENKKSSKAYNVKVKSYFSMIKKDDKQNF